MKSVQVMKYFVHVCPYLILSFAALPCPVPSYLSHHSLSKSHCLVTATCPSSKIDWTYS